MNLYQDYPALQQAQAGALGSHMLTTDAIGRRVFRVNRRKKGHFTAPGPRTRYRSTLQPDQLGLLGALLGGKH